MLLAFPSLTWILDSATEDELSEVLRPDSAISRHEAHRSV
jgi:hypothetical protein